MNTRTFSALLVALALLFCLAFAADPAPLASPYISTPQAAQVFQPGTNVTITYALNITQPPGTQIINSTSTVTVNNANVYGTPVYQSTQVVSDYLIPDSFTFNWTIDKATPPGIYIIQVSEDSFRASDGNDYTNTSMSVSINVGNFSAAISSAPPSSAAATTSAAAATPAGEASSSAEAASTTSATPSKSGATTVSGSLFCVVAAIVAVVPLMLL